MKIGHRKDDPSRAALIEAGEDPGFIGSAEQRTSQATQAMAEMLSKLLVEQRRTNELLEQLVAQGRPQPRQRWEPGGVPS